MNTIGKIFTLTTFGESHGKAIGGVIDGVPSGYRISESELESDMMRRRPGKENFTSSRCEADKVELLSGIDQNGITLGSPIGFIIRNTDARSEDYSNYSKKFRPNHADFTYFKKYGIEPQPGGGRSSARETACRVVAGSIAKMILKQHGIECKAKIEEIGGLKAVDGELSTEIKTMLQEVANLGDTVGGKVKCCVQGVPTGIGEPVYDKLQARLAEAMMSINAAKAFEYGVGINASKMRGSEQIEKFETDCHSNPIISESLGGGIAGGISNGTDIEFSVTFKPTPTLGIPVETIDLEGNKTIINPKGRHDTCVAIRAVAVVEAMAYITILDLMRMGGMISNRK